MKNPRFWVPVAASVLVTPALLLLAVGSAGVGHNRSEPLLPHVLFPFPLLALKLLGDAGPQLLLVLLLWAAQYPLYGLAVGLAARRGWGLAGAALVAILVVHGLAVAAEFPELFGGGAANVTVPVRSAFC